MTTASSVVNKNTVSPLRVVVTRPAPQAEKLVQAVTQAGFQAVTFPLLEISPVADPTALHAALSDLNQFGLVIFVSPNAISQTLRHMMQRGQRWPSQVPIAVMGPGSAQCLAENGIAAPQFRIIQAKAAKSNADSAIPRFDSEALLAELHTQGWDSTHPEGLAGKTILLVRGNGGRELLADQLRAAQAKLTVVEAYQRHMPHPSPDAWQAVRESFQYPTAWLLTSSEAVRNLAALSASMLTPAEQEKLQNATVIVPHARIVEAAQQAGFRTIRLSGAGDSQLLEATRDWAKSLADSTNNLQGRNAPSSWLQNMKTRAMWPIALLAGLIVATVLAVLGYRQFMGAKPISTNLSTAVTASVDTQSLQNQVTVLEARLAEAIAQQSQLVQRMQALQPDITGAQGRVLQMEAEQTINAAAQQLQLTGNVPQALAALQNMDTRLAASNQAQWLNLRRALAGDMARLKTSSQLDITGAAIKLDVVSGQINQLPMWTDNTKTATEPAPTGKANKAMDKAIADNASIWQQWSASAWRELQRLVQIRRVDDQKALLATPEQTWFVKETLKLRLLDAKVALLSRNEVAYRNDMAQIDDLLKRYADSNAPATQAVQASLQQIRKATETLSLPSLAASLAAARSVQ